MSGAIFSQDDDTGYPAPQALLREGFRARYIAPEIMPASTRCWHISLPDDPQVTAALHEILGILKGKAVWDGDNAEAMAALISNTLHEECEVSEDKMLFTLVNYIHNTASGSNVQHLTDAIVAGNRHIAANFNYKLGDTFKFDYVFSASNSTAGFLNVFMTPGFGGNLATFATQMSAGDSSILKLSGTLTAKNIRIEAGTGRTIVDFEYIGSSIAYRGNVDLQRHQWQAQTYSRYADTGHAFTLGSSWSGGGSSVALYSLAGRVDLKRV